MLREIEKAKQQASHAKFGIVFLELVFLFSRFAQFFLPEKKKQTWNTLLLRPSRVVVKFSLLSLEFSFSLFLFLVLLRLRDLDICFFIRFARNNCLVTCCLWKFSKKRSEAGRRIYFGYWVFLNIFFSACVSKRIDLLLFLFFGQFGICVSLGAEINDCASHNKKLKTNVV